MSAIKACANCNETPEHRTESIEESDGTFPCLELHSICCTRCWNQGPRDESLDLAIQHWNSANIKQTPKENSALEKRAKLAGQSVSSQYNQVFGAIEGRLKKALKNIQKFDKEAIARIGPGDTVACSISIRLESAKYALRTFNEINKNIQQIDSDVSSISEALLLNQLIED